MDQSSLLVFVISVLNLVKFVFTNELRPSKAGQSNAIVTQNSHN